MIVNSVMKIRTTLPGIILTSILSSGLLVGVPCFGQQTSSETRAPQVNVLASEIVTLFAEDQKMLADVADAKKDPSFRATYREYVERVAKESGNTNFYDPAVYELWANAADAPTVVVGYSAERRRVDQRLRQIVTNSGWPTRANVGDEAAADFFFLFGHADDDNAWRATQVSTIERVSKQDHVNPRLYAHLRDRIECVAGRAQIFGTIMGPGPTPGSAKLYWPILDGTSSADQKRSSIGLLSVEHDLESFRKGAEVGPYMTPLSAGAQWSIADVYR